MERVTRYTDQRFLRFEGVKETKGFYQRTKIKYRGKNYR